jgi:toxin YoeB
MSKRSVHFEEEAWKDYSYWLKTDTKMLKKIHRLLQETQRTPFEGTGKPEALKRNFSGYWSRRITEADRLIYKVTDDEILVIACRRHYDDR